MEETKGHKYHVLSLMWVLKTLASQEQRVGKRLWREGRQEREGSGNAIDSRYIAFFIRSLQGLWTFWTHDNYLRRWTHCSDFISTHFVFTSAFQTISHKCVQFKNINCLKKSLVAGTNSCLQSPCSEGLNVRDTEQSLHLPHHWPELIFAKQKRQHQGI